MGKIILLALSFFFFSYQGVEKVAPNCLTEYRKMKRKDHKLALDIYLQCLVDKKLEEKTKETLKNDLKRNHIMGEMINSPQMYTDSHITYKALLCLSSKADLFEMVESENPGWRYYGFLGIVEKYGDSVLEALKNVIQDTTVVHGKFGCSIEVKTLAEFCINEVPKSYCYGKYPYATYQLTTPEKKTVDSLMLSFGLKLD